jgi:hypothetical protein
LAARTVTGDASANVPLTRRPGATVSVSTTDSAALPAVLTADAATVVS